MLGQGEGTMVKPQFISLLELEIEHRYENLPSMSYSGLEEYGKSF